MDSESDIDIYVTDASDVDIYIIYMYQKSNFEYSNSNMVQNQMHIFIYRLSNLNRV
jgi:hypothetical protein